MEGQAQDIPCLRQSINCAPVIVRETSRRALTHSRLTCRGVCGAPVYFTVPAAERLSAFTFVLSYVVKTRPAIETGTGGARVRLPWKTHWPLVFTLHSVLIYKRKHLCIEGRVFLAVLTHFTVFPSESVRTHTSVTPCLLLTGASVAAGTRSTGVGSNWRETGSP